VVNSIGARTSSIGVLSRKRFMNVVSDKLAGMKKRRCWPGIRDFF